ncbi:MAG: galactokinase [Limisphaerales bacterium]
MLEVESFYKQKFGAPPVHVVQAPGRLELLGNHTDYNQGVVLALAVDRYIQMAASPRKDGRIELASTAYPDKEVFLADRLEHNPNASWANYVKGVLDELRKRGIGCNGFNAAIHGNVPIGAGMSSSAALEVATALTVREMYPYTISENGAAAPPQHDAKHHLPALNRHERLAMAKVCQAAENNFVGVKSGLLDQISSLFGKAQHAMLIDFLNLTVEMVPMIGDIAVVVCNSGVKHSLVGGEYNELRRECEAAALAMGVKNLRAVEPKMLNANKSKLTERQYQCAYHVVGEIQRVNFGERALRDGDFEQFGQFMFQSHDSSRDFFKNSTEELDLLVALARKHPAALGSRLTGGGFGGATINLVRRLGLESFMADMARDYTKQSGIEMTPRVCQIVDGAGAVFR